MEYQRRTIPAKKDSVAEAIQDSVMAYWENRVNEDGKETDEQFKMRSIVFPSMVISLAQLVFGVAYGVLKDEGIDEPSVQDCLSLMRGGNAGSADFFQGIRLFNSISAFIDEWLEQSAITDDFDHVWFYWTEILERYQKFCEKERTKTEKI